MARRRRGGYRPHEHQAQPAQRYFSMPHGACAELFLEGERERFQVRAFVAPSRRVVVEHTERRNEGRS